jgi:hypothetical protein
MRRTAALAISITLAAPSAAFAQSSGYGSSPSGGAPGAGGNQPTSASSLPFTGLDTLPLVGGGAALLLLGAGLAHGARARETR